MTRKAAFSFLMVRTRLIGRGWRREGKKEAKFFIPGQTAKPQAELWLVPDDLLEVFFAGASSRLAGAHLEPDPDFRAVALDRVRFGGGVDDSIHRPGASRIAAFQDDPVDGPPAGRQSLHRTSADDGSREIAPRT